MLVNGPFETRLRASMYSEFVSTRDLVDPVAVRAILAHLGEPTAPPRSADTGTARWSNMCLPSPPGRRDGGVVGPLLP